MRRTLPARFCKLKVLLSGSIQMDVELMIQDQSWLACGKQTYVCWLVTHLRSMHATIVELPGHEGSQASQAERHKIDSLLLVLN